ncbi:hypothetical protein GCG54_00009204 [Colletotrichum gloeosporioides]|uniref:Uncharacterized protein n=1 Tax=Colletotrichum gloeosporioides TaxID=474922 RepID=A0A8H4C514_COLGL|nr:uncharacterized protein GCG54_00009204 [Colletotrichum gloeosporioides]KAF3797234.1 hypothetical protein GCG54_00009204 [Colletotrichum gloeosporioides]
MAPEKDQNSERTASDEVDWDKMAEWTAQSKQAWIDPRTRREMARKRAKDAVVAESKPPELTAEERSKKLTELHAEMHEHVKRLVAERNPEQGPKESK